MQEIELPKCILSPTLAFHQFTPLTQLISLPEKDQCWCKSEEETES